MRTVVLAGYAAVIAAAVVLQLAAHRERLRLACLGDAVATLSRRRAGRVAVMLGWWWLGWHLFVR